MFNIATINIEQEFEVIRRMMEINIPAQDVITETMEFINVNIIQSMYKNNPYYKFFRRNPLIPSGGEDYLPEMSYDLEESFRYYAHGTMFENNSLWMDEVLNNIYNNVKQYYLYHSSCVLEIQYKYGLFMIVNHGDIRTIRFQEALDHQEIEALAQSQYEGG